MKVVRRSTHALKNLADREIDRTEAEKTLATPEPVVPGQPGRQVFMRRYFDVVLQQEMLLRVVVERTRAMRVTYDPQTDSLTITLRDERVKESDEVRPGVIADFGYDGGVVRFEIMQASKVVQNTREIQFAISE